MDEINHTLLTLIPKCNDPSLVSQFRPTALCNVVYKIVTKIITQRLHSIMPSVVAENQSSFISGRSTIDNILSLQETIHSFKQLHGKKGYMIIKLDLEKAYDRLEWTFVLETLNLLGLPPELIQVISHYLAPTSLRINWNGSCCSTITSTRGLRQGDPLSPYLFVLCLERLGHRIIDSVAAGDWVPFRFGRGSGPKLSHICFVDDLLLIVEALSDQVRNIKGILQDFSVASGQKVSLPKSQVFFSNNVSSSMALALSQDLGIQCTADLGVYLGAPMIHQRASAQSYKFILDKMRKKLSGWKATSLSFAGRITLAQASLSNIPGYVLQSAPIPAAVCDEVEKLCRDFIWGSMANCKKCHLVAWDRICKPKEEGGLGFRNLRNLNKAHMMKLAWELITCPDKLWVKIVKAKYGCGPVLCLWSRKGVLCRVHGEVL